MSSYEVRLFEGPGWVCRAGRGILCTESDHEAAIRVMAAITSLDDTLPTDNFCPALVSAFEESGSPVDCLAAAIVCVDGILLVVAGRGHFSTGGPSGTRVLAVQPPATWAAQVAEHAATVETHLGRRPFDLEQVNPGPPSAVVRGSGFRLVPATNHDSSPPLETPDDATAVRRSGSFDAHVAQRHDRPVVCILSLSDGQIFEVRRSVVVGRDPLPTSHDGRRECDTATVSSPDKTVSRNHFEIRVLDGDLLLIDRGSHNGTRLRRPGTAEMPLEGGATVELMIGDEIMFAHMTARVEPPGELNPK